MQQPILELQNLGMRFGGLELFSGINISVSKGEILGIIGTNGSGKTTLFNIICGIYKPAEGQVIYHGKDITGLPPYKIARQGIGRCFQMVVPFESMTPKENIRVARANAGRYGKGIELSVEEIMELTNLTDKQDITTNNLALPDKKNVEIARALACNPEVILFDEPTSALDPELGGEVLSVIRKVAAEGVSMVIVTHEMNFAREVADRILFMEDGVIVEDAPPEEFFEHPKNDRIRQFIRKVEER